MTAHDINLLRNRTKSVTAEHDEATRRSLYTVVVGCIALLALLVGLRGLLLVFGSRLEQTHQQLQDALNAQARKQVLLRDVHDRLADIKRYQNEGINAPRLIRELDAIASEMQFDSVNVQSGGRVIVSVRLPNVNSLTDVHALFTDFYDQGTIRDTLFDSILIEEDGTVVVGISFLLGAI